VALYHIAAAAAREGKTLEEVAEIAQHYADNMASITVKSTDATHPQNGMSFGDLGETDLMEIGAGQHGEGGGVRVPMMSSKDTVATVAEALCKALDLKPGDKTFVMINGCGATTMMEMLVLFKDTVEFLKAKGIEVVASMVGEILTVQEAAGFQMNIAKWDEEMLRLWNTPCRTPAFSKE
jgi:dihydroxyacetone kinase-like protein